MNREPSGRRVWAGLQLLDRQLVAHDDRLAGCVDDLELTRSDDGQDLYITAILSGPGALSYRFGHRRFGLWLRRIASVASAHDEEPVRIPFDRVADIGSHITVAIDADQTGTGSRERWFRDHVIDHVPGSQHEPE